MPEPLHPAAPPRVCPAGTRRPFRATLAHRRHRHRRPALAGLWRRCLRRWASGCLRRRPPAIHPTRPVIPVGPTPSFRRDPESTPCPKLPATAPSSSSSRRKPKSTPAPADLRRHPGACTDLPASTPVIPAPAGIHPHPQRPPPAPSRRHSGLRRNLPSPRCPPPSPASVIPAPARIHPRPHRPPPLSPQFSQIPN